MLQFEMTTAAMHGEMTIGSSQWLMKLLEYMIADMSSKAVSSHHVINLMNLMVVNKYHDRIDTAIITIISELFDEWIENGSNDNLKETFHKFCLFDWNNIYQKQLMKGCLLQLEKHISNECKGTYDEPQIPSLEKWSKEVLLPFACEALNITYTDGSNYMIVDTSNAATTTVNVNATIQTMMDIEKVLMSSLYQIFSKVRGSELFEIVAEFPDSMVAIKELKETASISSSVGYLGKIFKSTVKRRLLHTGASTSQILDIYILMIRSLRVIDPSDLLLNYVAVPVREYLMGRKDTVRSIVASLTEGESELHGELKRGGSLEYGIDEDDDDHGISEQWQPRKRDPDLLDIGISGLDVLALLVSIYGSTDLFVSEYRSLLADKLLNNLNYNTDQEVSTLELLKIRFGDEPLHSCEVMLRDIEDSRRVNNSIQSELTKGRLTSNTKDDHALVDYTIISHNYWPALPADADGIECHDKLQGTCTSYEDIYANLKKPRKLHIMPQLGQVDLELTFNDGSCRVFAVSLMQATIILHLQEESPIRCSKLCFKCSLEDSDMRKRIGNSLYNYTTD